MPLPAARGRRFFFGFVLVKRATQTGNMCQTYQKQFRITSFFGWMS